MKNEGDKYEKMTIQQLGLKPHGSGKRSNKYIPDAEIGNRLLEIKSCNLNSGMISTARDVSKEKIEKWRSVDWVFSGHRNGKIEKHIVVPREKMEPIFKRLEEKIDRPAAKSKFAGLAECRVIEESLSEFGLSDKQIEKILNTYRRGAKLNDPRLKWEEIERLGTVVNNYQQVREALNE
jgi:hypothetical protein